MYNLDSFLCAREAETLKHIRQAFSISQRNKKKGGKEVYTVINYPK